VALVARVLAVAEAQPRQPLRQRRRRVVRVGRGVLERVAVALGPGRAVAVDGARPRPRRGPAPATRRPRPRAHGLPEHVLRDVPQAQMGVLADRAEAVAALRAPLILVVPVPAGRRERVEGHDADPAAVALAPRHDPPLVEAPHRHQVVLAADHHVAPVGRPAHAQEAAEVAPRHAEQVH